MTLLAQPLTDTGHAQRVAVLYGDALRFVPVLGWMRWAGTHWKPDELRQHVEMVSTMAEKIIEEANDAFTGPQLTSYTAAARKIQNTGKLYAVVRRAETLPNFAVPATSLNADPWLFNHLGGTVELRSGEQRKHAQADLTTVCAPCRPHAGFHETKWVDFLEQVLPDPELRAFVQRAIGCSLIGQQREHAWFMATGGGGNGKGTFFRALQAALGEYAVTLPANFFIASPTDRHPTELMSLLGKRLAVSAELPADKHLDETKLKEVTGGDKVTARYMAKDFVEFWPSHTVWVCCNRKPKVRSTDNGFWRRANVVPFTVTIHKDQMDRDLDAKLSAERDSVLAWALAGTRLYLADGLGECKAVTDATAEYRADQDFFGTALADLCDLDHEATVRKQDFREALKLYYSSAGLDSCPTDPRIKAEFDQRGIGEGQIHGGARVWRGIRLKELTVAMLKSDAIEARNQQANKRY